MPFIPPFTLTTMLQNSFSFTLFTSSHVSIFDVFCCHRRICFLFFVSFLYNTRLQFVVVIYRRNACLVSLILIPFLLLYSVAVFRKLFVAHCICIYATRYDASMRYCVAVLNYADYFSNYIWLGIMS